MEVILLLVVPHEVVGDQPQLLLDDRLLLGRHRRTGECGGQARQFVTQQRVGQGKSDEIGAFGRIRHEWLLR